MKLIEFTNQKNKIITNILDNQNIQENQDIQDNKKIENFHNSQNIQVNQDNQSLSFKDNRILNKDLLSTSKDKLCDSITTSGSLKQIRQKEVTKNSLISQENQNSSSSKKIIP